MNSISDSNNFIFSSYYPCQSTSKHVCYVTKCRVHESSRLINSGKVKLVTIDLILHCNNANFVTVVKLELCVMFGFNKASFLET